MNQGNVTASMIQKKHHSSTCLLGIMEIVEHLS